MLTIEIFCKRSIKFPYNKKENKFRKQTKTHIHIPPTGYTGLMLHRIAVATASCSTVEGIMRILCSYCMGISFSAFHHSSVKVPSVLLRLAVATAVGCLAQLVGGIVMCTSRASLAQMLRTSFNVAVSLRICIWLVLPYIHVSK